MSIYTFKSKVAKYTDKEIKKIYNKRRTLLKKGHCVRCGYKLTETRMNCKYLPELKGQLISKGGIMKDYKCPSCETDLIEFCFQDILDEAKAKASEIINKVKKNKKQKSKSKEIQDTMF